MVMLLLLLFDCCLNCTLLLLITVAECYYGQVLLIVAAAAAKCSSFRLQVAAGPACLVTLLDAATQSRHCRCRLLPTLLLLLLTVAEYCCYGLLNSVGAVAAAYCCSAVFVGAAVAR